MAGQQQSVGQAAGEATAVLNGPGDGGAVGERADPLEQDADQVRIVLDGQRSGQPPTIGIVGHCDVDVLVRVDPTVTIGSSSLSLFQPGWVVG